MRKNEYGGLLIAFDGPNGAGKSTLIKCVQNELIKQRIEAYVTKEPSDTQLGLFTRRIAESLDGESLACLVAADRYHHLKEIIIPQLQKDKIVITDRYILSSLILQCMDNVEESFVLAANDRVIQPDVQIVVKAEASVLQARLSARGQLTRFERGQHSAEELYFMEKGVTVLVDSGVALLEIENTGNLQDNVLLIVKRIMEAGK